MVITRGKAEVGEVENGKGVINSDRTFDFGCMMQYIDDVLQSCTFETCIILLTNVTPINFLKKNFEMLIIVMVVLGKNSKSSKPPILFHVFVQYS